MRLLITHDFSVVQRASERVVVFYAGETVEEGATARILAQPRHPYTRGLLDALPYRGTPKQRFTVLPGQAPEPGSVPDGCAFRSRCPLAEERCEVPPRLEKTPGDRRVRCWVTGP